MAEFLFFSQNRKTILSENYKYIFLAKTLSAQKSLFDIAVIKNYNTIKYGTIYSIPAGIIVFSLFYNFYI
mgnify:CR=1 FL=1